MRGLGLVLSVGLSLVAGMGCTYYRATRMPIEPLAPLPVLRVAATDIEVLDQLPNADYVVVGKVHAHGRCHVVWGAAGCDDEDFLSEIKAEAAELGAEKVAAVVRTERVVALWREVHFHAKAIRLQR